MSIWSILCHTVKAENYQMTGAADNDKNSDKACPSGDPNFISVTFILQTMLQIPCFEVSHAYTAKKLPITL
jgi:hypothetical protein